MLDHGQENDDHISGLNLPLLKHRKTGYFDFIAGRFSDGLLIRHEIRTGIKAGSAAAGCNRFGSVGAVEYDFFDCISVERKQVAAVFEQYDTFPGDLLGNLPVFSPLLSHFRFFVRDIQQSHLDTGPHNAFDPLIQYSFGNGSIIQQFPDFIGGQHLRFRHFNINTRGHQLFGIINRPPIGHYHAVKSPFITEYIRDQPPVFRRPFSVQQVISGHYRLHIRLFNGGLERRKINFMQCAFIDNRVAGLAQIVGIVCRKMFYRRQHAGFLAALDIRDSKPRGQERILAEILKIASAVGHAVQVDPRPEQDTESARLALLGHRLAVRIGKFGVERGGQPDVGRKQDRVPCQFAAQRRISHLKAGNPQPSQRLRFADDLALNKSDAAEIGNLFIQRHPRHQILHPLTRRFIRIKIHRTGEIGPGRLDCLRLQIRLNFIYFHGTGSFANRQHKHQ